METLTVREAATLTGISAYTLRYYERVGVLAPVSRTTRGHRRYAQADLEHLRFLHCLRATGMPIRRMQDFAALARQGRGTLTDRRELLESHRREVQAHIEEMQSLVKVIEAKIQLFQQETRPGLEPAERRAATVGNGCHEGG